MSNMVVRTNVFSINTHRNLTNVGHMQRQSAQRLSSGYRINSAADDAAGLAITESMRAQIRGLDQASINSQDAVGLIQTAEGAMTTVSDMVIRIRELMVQAANDTNTLKNRDMIQLEIDQLFQEINDVTFRTQFNTRTLLDGGLTGGGGNVTPVSLQWLIFDQARVVGVSKPDGKLEPNSRNHNSFRQDIIDLQNEFNNIIERIARRQIADGVLGKNEFNFEFRHLPSGDPPRNNTETSEGNLNILHENGLLHSEVMEIRNVTSRLNIAVLTGVRTAQEIYQITHDQLTALGGRGATNADNSSVFTNYSMYEWFDSLSIVQDAFGSATTWYQGGLNPNSLAMDELRNSAFPETDPEVVRGKVLTGAQETLFHIQQITSKGTGTAKSPTQFDKVIEDALNISTGKPPADHDHALAFLSRGFRLLVGFENGIDGTRVPAHYDTRLPTARYNAAVAYNEAVYSQAAIHNASSFIDAANVANQHYTANAANRAAINAQVPIINGLVSQLTTQQVIFSTANSQYAGAGGTRAALISALITQINNAINSSSTASPPPEVTNSDIVTRLTSSISNSGFNQVSFQSELEGLLSTLGEDTSIAATALTAVSTQIANMNANLTTMINANTVIQSLIPQANNAITAANTALNNMGLPSHMPLLQASPYAATGYIIQDNESSPHASDMPVPTPPNSVTATRNAAAQDVQETVSNGNFTIGLIASAINNLTTSTSNITSMTNSTAAFNGAMSVLTPTVSILQGNYLSSLTNLTNSLSTFGNALTPLTMQLTSLRNNANQNALAAVDTALRRANIAQTAAALAADTAHSSNEILSHNAVYRPEAIPGVSMPPTPPGGFSPDLSAPVPAVVQSLNALRSLFSMGPPLTAPPMGAQTSITVSVGARAALDPSYREVAVAGETPFEMPQNYGFVSRLENLLDRGLNVFGTVNLENNAMWFQLGANSTQGMITQLKGIHTGVLGGGRGDLALLIDVRESNGIPISEQLNFIDNAENIVNTQRAQLGAVQNRLEYTRQSVDIASENITTAESRIRDADMAKEMMRFTQAQVLQSAGISMMAQANQLPNAILQLLQG